MTATTVCHGSLIDPEIGNIIESSNTHRVYDHCGVQYKLIYGPGGEVLAIEVKFPKGMHPNIKTMVASLPHKLSEAPRKWKIAKCDKKTILLTTDDGEVGATINKERWNHVATVSIYCND